MIRLLPPYYLIGSDSTIIFSVTSSRAPYTNVTLLFIIVQTTPIVIIVQTVPLVSRVPGGSDGENTQNSSRTLVHHGTHLQCIIIFAYLVLFLIMVCDKN
jgi:hypothetical protein